MSSSPVTPPSSSQRFTSHTSSRLNRRRTPAPPPAGTPPLPPLSSTVVNLDDNHQVGADHWDDGATSAGGQGAPVDGIECADNPSEAYHVHTHLSIFLDGQALAVPGSVGIHRTVTNGVANNCFYVIHTHDKSGKIHVEAAAPGTYTLGQLFDIWGQPLQGDNVAGLTGKPIVVYVTDAGVVTQAEGDWRNIELTSHREVTIQVGSAISEIPNFTWSAN